MAEITTAGYQDLRDRVEAAWTHIELRNDPGAAVVRLPLSDARVSWTHTPGAQELELTVVVKGSDADIPVPTTFASSALFKVATNGDALSVETFTALTIAAAADELTVKHRLQVPQII